MSNKGEIRILQCVNIMDRAGLETFLMNYYRNIDRNIIQFDFLTHRKQRGQYDEEIEKLGGKIYHAPRLMPWNFLKYRRYMKSFFEEHKEYKIIHSHIDAMSYFPLKEAFNNNVPIRIAHSHSTKIDKNYKYFLKKYAKINLKKYANNYFSCGKEAGLFLFNNDDFSIINNAIDTKKYRFNEEIRTKVRKQLKIDDNTFVIGHVGRFIYIKNQLFLLSILKEILEKRENTKLLLVGDGKDYKKIIKYINNNNLSDKVIILNNRSDVNDLYNAMDIFVMPSLFEGIPLVGIEAQTNGLPCIFSSSISKEILVTNNSYMLDLSLGEKEWANTIMNTDYLRDDTSVKNVINKGYDIKHESIRLVNIYKKLYEKIEGDKNEKNNK